MKCTAAVLLIAVLATACGFQLRGVSSVALPPELSSLRVTMGGTGFPPLLVEMRNALLASGNVRLTEDVSAGVPVLQLHGETSQSQVLAIDSSGRISAYLLNYRVDFSLAGADGKQLLPTQPVKLQREFTFDRLNVIATEKQSEFLQNEMRRDAAQQILRRLARLNFATAREGGRSGLLPSRGITPSLEGRSAGREAVPTGTNAGAVPPPRAADAHADQR